MKLYTHSVPPNPRKIDCLFKAKGVDINEVPNLHIIMVDLTKHEQFSAEFTAINPLNLLPVLVLDDGTIINDSQAICQYLDATIDGVCLMGSEPIQRAKITAMTRNAEFHVMYNAMLAFQHGHPARAEGRQVTGMADESLQRIKEKLPYFDNILAKNDYLVDNQLTFADIVLYVGLDFARVMKFSPKDSTLVGENVAKFYQRMNEKFALQK